MSFCSRLLKNKYFLFLKLNKRKILRLSKVKASFLDCAKYLQRLALPSPILDHQLHDTCLSLPGHSSSVVLALTSAESSGEKREAPPLNVFVLYRRSLMRRRRLNEIARLTPTTTVRLSTPPKKRSRERTSGKKVRIRRVRARLLITRSRSGLIRRQTS